MQSPRMTCDLKNEVKITQFELGLCLALMHLCTKFGEDTSNISSDIERKQSFICRRLNDLENEVKVTQFDISLQFALVLLRKNLARIAQIFLQILSKNSLAYHISYVVAFNVLVLQCTKLGEDTSKISRDIEWKPSFTSRRLK